MPVDKSFRALLLQIKVTLPMAVLTHTSAGKFINIRQDMLLNLRSAVQGLKQEDKLGVGSLIVAGGLAGVFYWGPVYPADIVKSKIQVDSFQNPQYSGSIDCAVKVRVHH